MQIELGAIGGSAAKSGIVSDDGDGCGFGKQFHEVADGGDGGKAGTHDNGIIDHGLPSSLSGAAGIANKFLSSDLGRMDFDPTCDDVLPGDIQCRPTFFRS
ncbi:hypothetical protein [Rhizobium sp. BK612]|uniref:hypothetical protein n=1 Tax=unclassified Rhizobium TaxID=2613769 RepID=UPI0032B1AB85